MRKRFGPDGITHEFRVIAPKWIFVTVLFPPHQIRNISHSEFIIKGVLVDSVLDNRSSAIFMVHPQAPQAPAVR